MPHVICETPDDGDDDDDDDDNDDDNDDAWMHHRVINCQLRTQLWAIITKAIKFRCTLWKATNYCFLHVFPRRTRELHLCVLGSRKLSTQPFTQHNS